MKSDIILPETKSEASHSLSEELPAGLGAGKSELPTLAW